ncbi:MAG TPA: rod shape-determining protein [Gemmataceae bacterium]|jgi:rod shape-determining protein MreB|nr:rod shape-determining protein [Gemmataceae bacterium]
MVKEVVYIGMDLGSFKTSVASSSGRRDVLQTAVGWPKDHLARTMLGRDVVFGNDLTEHRLALDIVRPFEKGVFKYNTVKECGLRPEDVKKHQEAAHLLVEHAVAMTRPPKGVPVYGVIGAPSRATLANKQVILKAAKGTFDAVMIVAEPFTIAYSMNRLSDTLVVDIGAGTIDLCPIYGTFPVEEEQVTIPLGGDFIDENFFNRMSATYPDAQLSRNMTREIKEKYGFVHDVNEHAIVTLPVKGKPKTFDVTVPLKEACRSIIDPIVKALRGLIGRFDPEFQQRMLQNIVLGGGGSQLRGLDRVIEEAMTDYGGAKVRRVDDAVYAGAVGALKLAMGLPADNWKKLQEGKQPAKAAVAA